MATDHKILAGYIDELKADAKVKRITANKHLCEIAEAFGQERTRNELVPFANKGEI